MNGLIGWFDAGFFDSSIAIWNNKVTGQANASTTGTIDVSNSNASNGAGGSFQYLHGNTSSTVTLNATPFNGNNVDYTFFHITKYMGVSYERIWDGVGSDDNWFSGFGSGYAGAYYQNGHIPEENYYDASMLQYENWLLSVDQNVGNGGVVQNYYLNDNGDYEQIHILLAVDPEMMSLIYQ